MDAQPQENFFDITVSQEGTERIMRLYKTVKWLFAICIIATMSFLVLGYYRMLWYAKLPTNGNIIFEIEVVLNPIYTFVLTFLMFVQVYMYFHFTRLCKRSVQLRQTDLFNYSFKWLYRSSIISLILISLEILMSLFSIYAIIYFMRQMPAS